MKAAAYWGILEERLNDQLARALRRKPSSEGRLAGAARVAASESPALRRALAESCHALVERGAFSRPLYGAAVRTLAETNHRGVASLLSSAMQSKDGGGLHTMAAALRCSAAKLREPLARVAANPRPSIAFAAAMVLRLRDDGPEGQLLSSVARIKESSRIELCTQMLAPLLLFDAGLPSLPASASPPMRVMRDAERHLGRWLVFARGGLAAGDRSSVEEAERRAREGSSSSRTAWSLLAWAIERDGEPPSTRPSSEIVARLSDRPTSEKDMSFLFRLASVRSDGARAMLESLCKGSLRGAVAVRAASVLAGQFDDRRGIDALRCLADGEKHRDLQGLATAALFDAGERNEAKQRAAALAEARNLSCAVWGGLVLCSDRPLIDELGFRRLECGMVQ